MAKRKRQKNTDSDHAKQPVKRWSRVWLQVVVILIIGSGVGLAYNSLSERGITIHTPDYMVAGDVVGWEMHISGLRATLPEVKRAFDQGETVFIDSRSPQMFAEGHVLGALNIPASKPVSYIRERLSNLPEDTPIITYCYGGGCKSSLGLAKLLIDQFGFQNVRVFHGGWPAWAVAGYPTKMGATP